MSWCYYYWCVIDSSWLANVHVDRESIGRGESLTFWSLVKTEREATARFAGEGYCRRRYHRPCRVPRGCWVLLSWIVGEEYGSHGHGLPRALARERDREGLRLQVLCRVEREVLACDFSLCEREASWKWRQNKFHQKKDPFKFDFSNSNQFK